MLQLNLLKKVKKSYHEISIVSNRVLNKYLHPYHTEMALQFLSSSYLSLLDHTYFPYNMAVWNKESEDIFITDRME